jgi:hypothetical protein
MIGSNNRGTRFGNNLTERVPRAACCMLQTTPIAKFS